ncbi:microtubule-binding protein MIP-T3-domain-containing protein [Cladochytrium replicatum]|nr:microtubule-binding protein MIP-T3-domain-containing protein [Cladochytrium replicatum]
MEWRLERGGAGEITDFGTRNMSTQNLAGAGGGDQGSTQQGQKSLDDLMKNTAEIMGRIIKKPPLNPKLLSKPPFRYLHDMFSELIRTTGFAGGLYDENEMNSENVKEKDAKVAYLTKMIDCVGLSTGVEVRANPLKIVAGMDPEETNLFIQLIGKVILKKIDTTDAVRRVLAGEHQGKRRPPPSAKPAHPQSARPPASSNGSAAPPRAEAPSRVSQPQTNPPVQSKHPAPKQQVQQQQQPPQQQQQQRQQAPVKEEVQTLQQQQNAQRPPIPQPSNPSQAQPKVQQQQQQPTSSQAQKRLEESQSQSVTDLSATVDQGGLNETDERAVKHSDADAEERQLKPVAQVSRRERPASARPAPPKQRPPEVAVRETGPSHLIIQEGARKVDDDEEYVIIPTEDMTAEVEVANESTVLDPDAQHGGLVRKILETKKELEGEPGEQTKKTAVQIIPDKASEKKEIVALRDLIQSLCRSTNPLGKMIHYVQEDVDSMNRELEMWKAEAEKYKESLNDEANITEGTLQPVEEKLKQVERDVEEQLENIRSTKTCILQNDASIKLLLSSLTTPRR